jgi:hypothetical protein
MSGSRITEAGLSASAGGITQSPISDCPPARGPKKSDARPAVTWTWGVVRGHRVVGHRGADAALAGVGLVGAGLGERPSVVSHSGGSSSSSRKRTARGEATGRSRSWRSSLTSANWIAAARTSRST